MKLSLIKLFNVLIWIFTFRSYKAYTYYYYIDKCDMTPIIAYKRAKIITKQEYNKLKIQL